MLEYESKMAEIRRIQEEKLAKQKEKEYQHELEVAKKRAEVPPFLRHTHSPGRRTQT
jgi:hypothetical protein